MCVKCVIAFTMGKEVVTHRYIYNLLKYSINVNHTPVTSTPKRGGGREIAKLVKASGW